MKSHQHKHILFGALAATFIAGGLLLGCKPDATPEAIKGKEWLTDFYKRYDIRGGWAFFGATAKDKNVEVVINIPGEQGKELSAFNRMDAIGFIANNACPPVTEDIWSILGESGDVIIDSRSNGNLLIKLSCRNKTGIEQ